MPQLHDPTGRNKDIYHALHDDILHKRFQSPSAIRRHAHQMQYSVDAALIPVGSTVLDAGCGDGVLSVLLAKQGCIVTGIDMSQPNIDAAKAYAEAQGVKEKTIFLVGDVEHLPFDDRSFEYVVSSHVLEHVPDFLQGAREIRRVTKKKAVIAIPTCLNLSAMALLGGDKYWAISRRSLYAVPLGCIKVLAALVSGQEGVNETYAGHAELIHIRRFPWRGKKLLEQAGFRVIRYRGSSYIFPYLPFLLPIARLFEKLAWLPIIRECGFGVTYECDPAHEEPHVEM